MQKLPTVKKNSTLSSKAYQIIKEAIISNRLHPNELLVEGRLADELQISRTPIKAALRRLEFEKFVSVNENGNVFVSDVTIEDAKNIIEARLAFEPYVMRLLNGQLTERQMALLEDNLNQMKLNLEVKALQKHVDLDYNFHVDCAVFTGNDMLADIAKQIHTAYERYTILSSTSLRFMRWAVAEHSEIVERLKRREFELAAQAAEKHIQNIYQRLQYPDDERYSERT